MANIDFDDDDSSNNQPAVTSSAAPLWPDEAPAYSHHHYRHADQSADNCTLFVRNLPYTTTDDSLETHFATVGPIKRAFVVHDKKTNVSKGYGFVRYAVKEDAEAAVRKFNNSEVDDRIILVEFAKPDKAPFKAGAAASSEQTTVTASQKQSGTPTSTKSIDTDTIVLGHIPTNVADLREHLPAAVQQHLQTLIFPSPESNAQWKSARLSFSTVSQCKSAVSTLANLKIKSIPIRIVPLTTHKVAKLIVRNLPFNCTEAALKQHVQKDGEDVAQVKIPIKAGTTRQLAGFGFLTYNSIPAAQHVIDTYNGTMLNGRPIAIDWALDKSAYVERLDADSKVKAEEKAAKDAERQAKLDAKAERREFNLANRDRKRAERAAKDAAERGEPVVKDEDEQKAEPADVEEITVKSEAEDEADDSSDDEELAADQTDDDAADNSDDDLNDTSDVAQPTPFVHPTDKRPAATIFIRNVPYDATEQQLHELFSRHGTVKMAKLVVDKQLNNRPKGTAFVQFEDADVADRVVALAAETSPAMARSGMQKPTIRSFDTLHATAGSAIHLNGRTLNIALAVSRDEAGRLEADNTVQRERADKRNTYLAKEGQIKGDSPAAQAMTKRDLERRQEAYKEKQAKLQNPNFSISRTRLSIRNLPMDLDEKQLKRIVQEAIKDTSIDVDADISKLKAPIHIVQTKIARSNTRFDSADSGLGRSKRYGFVELEEHLHALKALRMLNNNPKIWGKTARPIVEFALVDARKAHLAKLKIEKVQRMQEAKKQQEASKTAGAQPAVVQSATGVRVLQPAAATSNDTTDAAPKTRKRKARRPPLSVLLAKQNAENGGEKVDAGTPAAPAKPQEPQQVTAKRQKVDKPAAVKPAASTLVKPIKERPQPAKPNSTTTKPAKPAVPAVEPELKSFKPQKKRNREADNEARFDKLVQDYKHKLFGSGNDDQAINAKRQQQKQPAATAEASSKPKTRWFDL